MSKYIVFWKSQSGQQVSTIVDAHNQPVLRDEDYLKTNDIDVLDTPEEVFQILSEADGEKVAVQPELARITLGWDV